MNPVITVRGLTARTGDAVLLDGVDFEVHAGRVTALVGPSGSGKTTAALALLGEAGPGVRLGGRVAVDGVAVVDGDGTTEQAPGVRGRVVAYMPQHPGSTLNPARRTGSVLAELARLHHGAAGQAAVTEALRSAQLPPGRDTERRFPHQFSGGQRQRVALAQTLVCRPRVLILDEPSTGLDTVTRMRLAGELAELARTGLGILLLSHDHDLVRTLADHVVVLGGGRVTGHALPDRRPLTRTVAPGPPPAPAPADAAQPPVPPVPPVLRVRGLTAYVRTRRRDPVLHAVDLALPAGGCVGVAGLSGGGKTTLARCIAGLHERYRGQVLLDGAALPVLRRRTREQKRRVQYVWQEVRGSFDERRPVAEQVARTRIRLHGQSPGEAREEALALLTRLGLAPGAAQRRPGGLSGGELQRAALARALLAAPDVLICDEITTALDPEARDAVLAELSRLRAEHGTALLWVSHDLELLAALAQHIVVIDGGHVVESGAAGQVLHHPQADITRQLVCAMGPLVTPSAQPAPSAPDRAAVSAPGT
ncbi:ABC transporter ATP-binding protein [Streptomyces gobiensis]|uniref:ABC transporter ATP-binding protein n=1 Tax=Streptomyces gobiensis TaxID=2875706 RepID=UPI001E426F51|nr:ATP-binding cassette domain-containing protein [Streptomyces gobiensis]UGY92306.1 ATP-binding cassette domain-containing protein [Streptomyces gobiensis]